MEKLENCIFIISILILIYFTHQITLQQSLAEKLNLIFKVRQIKIQKVIPLWTHMGHKE